MLIIKVTPAKYNLTWSYNITLSSDSRAVTDIKEQSNILFVQQSMSPFMLEVLQEPKLLSGHHQDSCLIFIMQLKPVNQIKILLVYFRVSFRRQSLCFPSTPPDKCIRRLVSKETVVLCLWGVEANVWFINRVNN